MTTKTEREPHDKDELTALAEQVVQATTKYLTTGVGPMFPAIDDLADHLGMPQPSTQPRRRA